MARPLPLWPRGPRRLRNSSPQLLLACPRMSPEWELSAVRALIKPQTRGAVEHRDGSQAWSPGARRRIDAVLKRIEQSLAARWTFHFPDDGEYFLIAQIPAQALDEAKAIALALSMALPENWFVLGRLFIRDGRFFRRRFGYRLEIVPATNVHLTRPLRQLLKELI